MLTCADVTRMTTDFLEGGFTFVDKVRFQLQAWTPEPKQHRLFKVSTAPESDEKRSFSPPKDSNLATFGDKV